MATYQTKTFLVKWCHHPYWPQATLLSTMMPSWFIGPRHLFLVKWCQHVSLAPDISS